jgi:uncharacterized protein YbbK (DUF523 family)
MTALATPSKSLVLVSACLAGAPCRYDGKACPVARVQKLLAKGEAIALCPEQLAGLPTPRGSHEIVQGRDNERRVLARNGEDATAAYRLGAERTLTVCRALGITHAILKSRSPSCGCGHIYDGSFSGRVTEGEGLTAALLRANGLTIESEGDAYHSPSSVDSPG